MNLLKKYLEQFNKKHVAFASKRMLKLTIWPNPCLTLSIWIALQLGFHHIYPRASAVAQHCSLTFFPPACTCTRQTWFDEQGRNTSVAGSPMPHSWTFWPVTLKCGDYLQPQWEQSPSRPVRTETRCKDKFSHGILGAIFPATSWNFVFRHAEQHCHREQRIL